jgi:hypothetical protein
MQISIGDNEPSLNISHSVSKSYVSIDFFSVYRHILVLHYYYYCKFIFAYYLPDGGLLLSSALNNRSKRFTPALTNAVCSAH